MRVLVTGNQGFIGKNMVSFLSHQPYYHVEGWDWHPTDWPNVRDFEWVIHLGAIADVTETDVEKCMVQNYDFSCYLFQECNRLGVNLQYASSSTVYGNTNNFEEYAPCYPQTPYAWTKYLFDRWVFEQNHKIFVQGFRYFNVYGKWMHLRGKRANAICKWQEQARRDGFIEVWQNSEHIFRDWTWVGDICQLQLDFINKVKGSGIWNVGAGLPHSFLDIAEAIAEKENVPIRYITMPQEEIPRFRAKTCADLRHLKSTIGKRKWLNVYEWLNLP